MLAHSLVMFPDIVETTLHKKITGAVLAQSRLIYFKQKKETTINILI